MLWDRDWAMSSARNHISVCICTYKRARLLARLLTELENQITDQLFTYSVVVADNDYAKSGKNVVQSFNARHKIGVRYCNEPEQNIALARNKAVENADGYFVAFIDDDECPASNWLLNLQDVQQV